MRVLHAILCPMDFNLNCCRGQQGGVLKRMNYLYKNVYNVCSISSGLGLFPQVFEQVKEWRILKLHEMILVSHVVAFSIVFFIFFYDQY